MQSLAGDGEQRSSTDVLGSIAGLNPILRRELFFGLVCPLGADKSRAREALEASLRKADYSVELIKISDALPVGTPVDEADPLGRKLLLMNAGDRLRDDWHKEVGSDHILKGEATGLLAANLTREKRRTITNHPAGLQALESTAFIIDSLKHPDELAALREIYGSAFFGIGLYMPQESRVEQLSKDTEHKDDKQIEDLIHRDQRADNPLGQQIEEAFHQCDFIVDVTKRAEKIGWQIERFIKLVFGDPQVTPSAEELAMFIASGAQARSGSLGRQVGSAIVRHDGTVVSIGTNEVPKAIIGGQYWAKDDHKYKGRDIDYESRDTSDSFRREAIVDVLRLMSKTPNLKDFGVEIKLDEGLFDDDRKLNRLVLERGAPLKDALIRDSIDRIRAVHAETAAIIDAARHGIETKGHTMYVTTFPCHECARHIVAAGIREVVYLAPYPKSAAATLYKDSIQIESGKGSKKKVRFTSFVGVTPRRYLDFFVVGTRDRKAKDGRPVRVPLKGAVPYLPDNPIPAHLVPVNELGRTAMFSQFMKRKYPARTN